MELTTQQQATIEYFGLEVVEFRLPKEGEYFIGSTGAFVRADSDFTLSAYPIVRPAHAAKVAELRTMLSRIEYALAGESRDMDASKYDSSVDPQRVFNLAKGVRAKVAALEAQVAALESELAPIRALKVGSWQWAMVRRGLGDKVIDRDGDMPMVEAWSKYEPFTLHTAPEPEPSAAELAAAIGAYESVIEAGGDPVEAVRLWKTIKALASRVKRKEDGE